MISSNLSEKKMANDILHSRVDKIKVRYVKRRGRVYSYRYFPGTVKGLRNMIKFLENNKGKIKMPLVSFRYPHLAHRFEPKGMWAIKQEMLPSIQLYKNALNLLYRKEAEQDEGKDIC